MADKPELSSGGPLAAQLAALRRALREAEGAIADGDAAAGERLAKAVSALVRASRDVAEFEVFARAQTLEDDEDALRAELRRRIALLADADGAGAPPQILERIIRTGAAE